MSKRPQTGIGRAVRRLEEDTAPLPPEEAETLHAGLAFLAAFRTFMDRDFEYAVQFSKEYVEKHPEGDFFIGFGSDGDGYHPVWDIYVSDDSLRLAEQVLTPLLSIWSETRNVLFVAHLYIDLGKMQYERNRLVEAEKLMRQAYDIGRLHDNRSLATIAALWLARIAAVQGDEETSNQILRELTQQTSKMANPHLSGKIAWFRAMQGWMHGEEKPVKRWLRKCGLRFHDEIPVSMIKEYDLLVSVSGRAREIRGSRRFDRASSPLSIEDRTAKRPNPSACSQEHDPILTRKDFGLHGRIGRSAGIGAAGRVYPNLCRRRSICWAIVGSIYPIAPKSASPPQS